MTGGDWDIVPVDVDIRQTFDLACIMLEIIADEGIEASFTDCCM